MTATAYGSADKLPLTGGTLTGTLTLNGSPPLTIAGTTAVTATTTIANTTTRSALQSATIAANDPAFGAVYEIEGEGVFSDTGTPTMTFGVYWGGTSGTLLVAIPAITAPSGVSNAAFTYKVRLTFRSATSVIARIKLLIDTSTATDAASSYVAVSSAPVTVTTSSSSALAVAFTWGTANASNTISLLGGLAKRVA